MYAQEILVDCSGAPDQQRSMEQVMNNKKNALLEVQIIFILLYIQLLY